MLTVVEFIFVTIVSLSLLTIFVFIMMFFSAVIVGLFGKKSNPLAEELDEFLEDLLGPNASPWREPERMHGRRHR